MPSLFALWRNLTGRPARRGCVYVGYSVPDYSPCELPERRRRLSLGEEGFEEGDACCDQLQARFFGVLPLELRIMIYTEVLAGSTKLRQLLHPKDALPCFEVRNSPARNNKLALLQSCRRIYSEAVDQLYSNTDFAISDEGPMERSALEALSRCVPLQHLQQIRSLTLHAFVWWPEDRRTSEEHAPYLNLGLEIVSRIHANKLVIVVLEEDFSAQRMLSEEESNFSEERLLEPLSRLGPYEVFEVHVGWQEDRHRADASKLPFRLLRRPAPPSATT